MEQEKHEETYEEFAARVVASLPQSHTHEGTINAIIQEANLATAARVIKQMDVAYPDWRELCERYPSDDTPGVEPGFWTGFWHATLIYACVGSVIYAMVWFVQHFGRW